MTCLTPQTAQFFLRASNRPNTYMVCGMMSGPEFPGGAPNLPGLLAQNKDELSLLIAYPQHPYTLIHQDMPLQDEQRRTLDSCAEYDLGSVVTQHIWNAIAPGSMAISLQYVIRQVWGHSDLCMIAGILQDEGGMLPKTFKEGEVLIDATIHRAMIKLQIETLRSVKKQTTGSSLPQVLKMNLWELGADEPWGAYWTVRGDLAAKGDEANALRHKMVLGTASQEENDRFYTLQRETGHLVKDVAYDHLFAKMIKHTLLNGGFPERKDPAISTKSEADASAEVIRKSIEATLAADAF